MPNRDLNIEKLAIRWPSPKSRVIKCSKFKLFNRTTRVQLQPQCVCVDICLGPSYLHSLLHTFSTAN